MFQLSVSDCKMYIVPAYACGYKMTDHIQYEGHLQLDVLCIFL